jgi:hypothetical protein
MIEELKAHLEERLVGVLGSPAHARGVLLSGVQWQTILSALEAVPVMKEALTEARGIIEQIGPDFRYPPATDSIERRVQRANRWLERADAILELGEV